MSGPYRDDIKRPGAFQVEVTVTIYEVEVAQMVREYMLAHGWDPRKLPAPEKLDVSFGYGGTVVVAYSLDGEAP
jgi:hypothetical protein